MSYLVLARKYRPQTFDQIVQQDHIVRTLTNAIAMNRMAHAVLFAGPRGTGKTTVARILAKAMNCQQGPTATPCNACRSCSDITSGSAADVFEIDGASNNSVDQIRDLRDNLRYMPAHSTYKIYIIDEVHMLSLAAFNALLKTLEEPPAHVMFLFATTEPHKIPITILSRCQRHDFRRIATAAVADHLMAICRSEGRRLDEEGAGLIAREAGGSMRDALSLLDHALACIPGDISGSQLIAMLGFIDRSVVGDLAVAVCRAEIPAALDLISRIYDNGWDLKRVYADLVQHVRNLLVVKIGQHPQRLVDLPAADLARLSRQADGLSSAALGQVLEFLCRQEQFVRFAVHPRLAMEMVVVRLAQIKPALSIDELVAALDDLRRGTGPAPAVAAVATDAGPPPGSPRAAAAGLSVPGPAATGTPAEIWAKVVDTIGRRQPSLAAVLAKSSLKDMAADTIVIAPAGGDFQAALIQQNLAAIGKVCQQVMGRPVGIKLVSPDHSACAVPATVPAPDTATPHPPVHHGAIGDVLDTLGGTVIEIKSI